MRRIGKIAFKADYVRRNPEQAKAPGLPDAKATDPGE